MLVKYKDLENLKLTTITEVKNRMIHSKNESGNEEQNKIIAISMLKRVIRQGNDIIKGMVKKEYWDEALNDQDSQTSNDLKAAVTNQIILMLNEWLLEQFKEDNKEDDSIFITDYQYWYAGILYSLEQDIDEFLKPYRMNIKA